MTVHFPQKNGQALRLTTEGLVVKLERVSIRHRNRKSCLVSQLHYHSAAHVVCLVVCFATTVRFIATRPLKTGWCPDSASLSLWRYEFSYLFFTELSMILKEALLVSGNLSTCAYSFFFFFFI